MHAGYAGYAIFATKSLRPRWYPFGLERMLDPGSIVLGVRISTDGNTDVMKESDRSLREKC
ncbi:hypothetical protein GCM10010230_39200 [Streptomyces narbonensis]|nr:hypothetical protein GCM10010230_39200 [Streptomyces narbonensis]